VALFVCVGALMFLEKDGSYGWLKSWTDCNLDVGFFNTPSVPLS
jgi:hypothetical protein